MMDTKKAIDECRRVLSDQAVSADTAERVIFVLLPPLLDALETYMRNDPAGVYANRAPELD